MTTQSRAVLGRNPRRARSKGAFGKATTPERGKFMVERVNAAFNEKLEKMRKKKQEQVKPEQPINDK